MLSVISLYRRDFEKLVKDEWIRNIRFDWENKPIYGLVSGRDNYELSFFFSLVLKERIFNFLVYAYYGKVCIYGVYLKADSSYN